MVVLEAPLEPLDVAFVLLMACQVAFSPWQMLTVAGGPERAADGR